MGNLTFKSILFLLFFGLSAVVNGTSVGPNSEASLVTLKRQMMNNETLSLPTAYAFEYDETYLTKTGTSSWKGKKEGVTTITVKDAAGNVMRTYEVTIFAQTPQLKVYLEGALLNSGNLTSATGKPLMRDDLRRGDGTNSYLPGTDPYLTGMGNNNFARKVHVGLGTEPAYQTISNLTAVLTVTGDDAIVDWVFVELRSGTNPTQVLAARAALLQRDGDVVDLDGSSSLKMTMQPTGDVYVAVVHRNHLAVMSKIVTADAVVDFTNANTAVFDFGASYNGFDYRGLSLCTMPSGVRALWAGDFNGDGLVSLHSSRSDLNALYFDVILHPNNTEYSTDFTNATGYANGDFDMDGRAIYMGESDDKNKLKNASMSFPINTHNTENFEGMISQIPN